MRHARKGLIKDVVHLFGGERHRRWIQPELAPALVLNQGTRIARIGFQVQHTISVCVQHRVVCHNIERGQTQHGLVTCGTCQCSSVLAAHEGDYCAVDIFWHRTWARYRLTTSIISCLTCLCVIARHDIGITRRFYAPRSVHTRGVYDGPVLWQLVNEIGRAAQIGDVGDGITACETMSDVDDGAFAVPIDEHVCLGIGKDGATHLVLPIVVVRDTTQRGLDAADHDRGIAKGFAATLGIDDG